MEKRALCIGINNYPGTNNDLSGCVNDVKDWAAELKTRGFKLAELIDKAATSAQIVNSLNELVSARRARATWRSSPTRGTAHRREGSVSVA